MTIHMLYLNIKLKNPLKKNHLAGYRHPAHLCLTYLQESQPETTLLYNYNNNILSLRRK